MMFQHLRNKFGLTKSKTKIKESIFVGPKICEWMSDDWFQMKLNPARLSRIFLAVTEEKVFLSFG